MSGARFALVAAGGLGLVAVGLGAFGAHGLEARLVETGHTATWETASRYALAHAVALLAIAALAERRPSRPLAVAAWAFLGGTVVFSGTLWVLSATGITWLGAITPLGGLSLLAGWTALLVAGWRLGSEPRDGDAGRAAID